MTNEEAIEILQGAIKKPNTKDGYLGQAIDMAIKALEREPCEDWCDVPSDEMTLEQARQAVKDLRKMWAEYIAKPCEDEYIKVPKKALKYRTAGMVAYNAEWLKDHFDIERAVICGAQKSCEDVAKECYEDLCRYFGDAKDILKNREDFKAWLDRIKWHIHKAEELSAENDDLRDQLAMCDRFQKQEPCLRKGEPMNDLISRQAALASIKNLYPDMPIADIFGARRKWLEKYAPYFECENAIEQLLSYNSIKTELETCGDCVNRQAALRQAINAHKMAQENGFDFKDICEEYLNVLPPVTPQPEVIRCKDCKHWTNNIGNSALRDNYCNEEAHGFYYRCSGGDYCSFAERRNDG